MLHNNKLTHFLHLKYIYTLGESSFSLLPKQKLRTTLNQINDKQKNYLVLLLYIKEYGGRAEEKGDVGCT